MPATIIKPPTPLPLPSDRPSLFLAGSIEMGGAEDWQAQFAHELRDLEIDIFNPRRDEWDASWEQSIANPQFREQVEWELQGLEQASVVAMYFAPATKAPITLLELGLVARSAKAIVCCPAGFWRRGNIEVVCARFNIPLVDSLPDLIVAIRQRLQSFPPGATGVSPVRSGE